MKCRGCQGCLPNGARLSPHGESGLKSTILTAAANTPSRLSPHGESGLKFLQEAQGVACLSSLPARGEWIEMKYKKDLPFWGKRLSPHGESGLKSDYMVNSNMAITSLPARGEWIEIFVCRQATPVKLSLPARGEWIEMSDMICISPWTTVSPRTGRVD